MHSLDNIVAQILERVQHIPFIDIGRWDTDSRSFVERTIETCLRDCTPKVCERIQQEFFGDGPLATILDDKTITEIIVHSHFGLWVERAGEIKIFPDRFLSALTFRNFLHRLTRDIGTQTTLEHPFCSGHWKDFRVHVSGQPVSPDMDIINLRRHKQNGWTLRELEERKWCTEHQHQILKDLAIQKQNMLIVGPTGCGKTSCLGALLQLVHDSERVGVIEDTPEIPIPNTLSFRLLTRQDSQRILPEITAHHLLREALRMRPHRLVMGEVRGDEAKDLLLCLSTGHAGSYGTLHALSAQEALIRLEMLTQLGAPNWSVTSIRKLIQLCIQYIVVVGFDKKGCRALIGIHKVTSVEDFGILTESIES